MSKIEDALNKAKENQATRLSVVDSGSHVELNKRELVNDPRQNRIKKSGKEIMQMDDGDLLGHKSLSNLNVIFSDMPDSSTADGFRDIRTKIINKFKDNNVSVLLTSCVPGYSSTYTAVNLAAAFSFDANKTSLLIDCNINKPKINNMLAFNSDVGLSDYLENDELDVSTIIQKTGIKRLRAITAGNNYESSTEYFTLDKMKHLLKSLLTRYDDRYVFIDSPPIVDSANTRILVDYVDAVVLIVPYGKVSTGAIKSAVEGIASNKLIGIVFSDKPCAPKFKNT